MTADHTCAGSIHCLEPGGFHVLCEKHRAEIGSIIMRSCTGCYEPGEMGTFETLYPWSKEHQCRIGAGCDECGGSGLVEMHIPSEDECREMALMGPFETDVANASKPAETRP